MGRELTPGMVLRGVARAVYSDLVTVVTTSLAFVVVSLPLVTVGAALLALVDTWTTIITQRDTGAPVTERGRLSFFGRSVVSHFRAGIPYSVVLLTVTALTTLYALVGLQQQSGVFVLAAGVGVYVVIGVTMWCLRAASIHVRTDPSPSLRDAFEQAGLMLLDRPYFAVLIATLAAVVVILATLLRVAVPLLVPTTLAIVEVVSFEELAGEGAATVRATYRGDR